MWGYHLRRSASRVYHKLQICRSGVSCCGFVFNRWVVYVILFIFVNLPAPVIFIINNRLTMSRITIRWIAIQTIMPSSLHRRHSWGKWGKGATNFMCALNSAHKPVYNLLGVCWNTKCRTSHYLHLHPGHRLTYFFLWHTNRVKLRSRWWKQCRLCGLCTSQLICILCIG